MRKTKKSKITVTRHGASIAEVFNHVHREIVRTCEYCSYNAGSAVCIKVFSVLTAFCVKPVSVLEGL